MEPYHGICAECGVESPLDNNDKCSICGTKDK